MANGERDHYAVLGVGREFTAEQLKSKYHELAREHHPDRNHGNEEAAADAFKLVQLAYKTLSDPDERRLYDIQKGASRPGPGGPRPSGPQPQCYQPNQACPNPACGESSKRSSAGQENAGPSQLPPGARVVIQPAQQRSTGAVPWQMRAQQLSSQNSSQGTIKPQAVSLEFNPASRQLNSPGKKSRQLVVLPRWPLAGRSKQTESGETKAPKQSLLARIASKLFGKLPVF